LFLGAPKSKRLFVSKREVSVLFKALKRLFDYNEKEIKRLKETASRINQLEEEFVRKNDSELAQTTVILEDKLAQGASLDEILPEAFACVREAAKRCIGERHFDTQLMGGIVLHEGRIAEMKTGEGKTLAATLPVYLNALTGQGVHVVTVNDYLAKRDAEWMGKIYRFLGLSVGVIVHGLSTQERRDAYFSDITYGTNNEFGFDYLRDNMVIRPDHMVQRGLNYAIVDEVDSILIDEARTPLIISGQAEQSTELYYQFAKLVPRLKKDEHYTVDEKTRQVAVTEAGVEVVEKALGVENLYDDEHFELVHQLNQALKAHSLFRKDRDYVVKDGEVIIVDEFTGRLMFGRRYSDGLHQAIEAKENVKIERESQTLASITFQNYFRMYKKLAGMTGTAKTEEAEFRKIYGMDVVVLPTHMPMIRQDLSDLVYKTSKAKFNACVEEIVKQHQTQRPILVGTISIAKSEQLSEMLKKRGVPHQVLNAKYHDKEAEIIAQAGRLNAVTIATNMAGRGTDIMLGGNPEFLAKDRLRKEFGQELAEEALSGTGENPQTAEVIQRYQQLLQEYKALVDEEKQKVIQLGGLFILGTERHESRRIDNQLRGRAGRQGDPGASRFVVSLEDDLMRLFGSDRIKGIMERLGWQDDQPIEHYQLTRTIENAQRKVENYHFDMRKHVLEYDDVLNRQRGLIYSLRKEILQGQDLDERLRGMEKQIIDSAVEFHCDKKLDPSEWRLEELVEYVSDLIAGIIPIAVDDISEQSIEEIKLQLQELFEKARQKRVGDIGPERFKEVQRLVLLSFIDNKWMDHLKGMDELREGIGLRAYGQQHPLLEYQKEAFEMFQDMLHSINEDTVKYMFRVQIVTDADRVKKAQESRLRSMQMNRGQHDAPAPAAQRRVKEKVGRNDPCPCGSGKKYKQCCGAR
jgi:preprotein translocase subunit SecA